MSLSHLPHVHMSSSAPAPWEPGPRLPSLTGTSSRDRTAHTAQAASAAAPACAAAETSSSEGSAKRRRLAAQIPCTTSTPTDADKVEHAKKMVDPHDWQFFVRSWGRPGAAPGFDDPGKGLLQKDMKVTPDLLEALLSEEALLHCWVLLTDAAPADDQYTNGSFFPRQQFLR